MGGIGSGNRHRWNTQTTAEEVRRVDIRHLKRIGALNCFYSGSLSWTCRGEDRGHINYTSRWDSLELDYRYREYGDDWQPVKQLIHYDRTPCNYGGERLWLLCPRCEKRVGVLYGVHILFLCRHCYKLPYASQNKGRIDTLINQQHKLGERIFEHYENGEGFGKKKGLHWKTFNRLHKKYEQLEMLWGVHMKNFFNTPS